MKNNLVALVNPNRLHPGIPPIALDILTTSLEQGGFTVEVLDLTFQRERCLEAVDEYFKGKDPLLVGITIRNTDTIYPQEQRVFLEDHLEIISRIKLSTSAPIIGGGVGFSSMPYALVEYFGIPFGAKGPGEIVITNLARVLAAGGDPSSVPGLILNDGGTVRQISHQFSREESPAAAPALAGVGALVGIGGVPRRNGSPVYRDKGRVNVVNKTTAYSRRTRTPLKVDNFEYYTKGGLANVLFKNGCPFTCNHCVEPDAKGSQLETRAPSAVADELESLAAQGVLDVHTTDSEVNIGAKYAMRIFEEVANRKELNPNSPLHRLRIWAYCQPSPFTPEFARLLRAAGGAGVNFGTDHTRPEMIKGDKLDSQGRPYYDFDDVRRANDLVKESGMLVMHDILFGMPGETIETIYGCIDDTLGLDATVIGYTLGIRFFPYSPLGIQLARESGGRKALPGVQSNTAISPILLKPLEDCESVVEYERQFMFDEFGRLRPLYYFSPELPEDPRTIAAPNGKWTRTLELMREYVPEDQHYRVMLPTVPGLTKDDNNYADNPYLRCLAKLGYKGAFWSRWRERDAIMREAVSKGIARFETEERFVVL